MRSTFARFAGLLGFAVLLASCAKPGVAVTGPTVSVNIRCPGGHVIAEVGGWRPHVTRNGSVTWKFAKGANAANITITAKNPGQWPLTPAPPYTVPKDGMFQAPVSASATPGTYGYTITGVCTDSSDPRLTYSVVIDPDIVVD
jgi:hypothetical protein